jgi:hypothetical protein
MMIIEHLPTRHRSWEILRSQTEQQHRMAQSRRRERCHHTARDNKWVHRQSLVELQTQMSEAVWQRQRSLALQSVWMQTFNCVDTM